MSDDPQFPVGLPPHEQRLFDEITKEVLPGNDMVTVLNVLINALADASLRASANIDGFDAW